MSFLIFGAGAIGTYLGASLAGSGQRVVVLEREVDLPILRQRGLSLIRENGSDLSAQAEFISDLKDLKANQITACLLAVKTYHLPAILPRMAELQDQLPPLICFQNGVESEASIREAIPGHQVIPGAITTAVEGVCKGRAKVTRFRGLGLAGDSPLLAELEDSFQRAGLNPRLYTSEESLKWSKLITNLLGNASAAILNLPPGQIYQDPALYQLEVSAVREALGVMRARGILVQNLPGIPVKALAAVMGLLPPAFSRLVLQGRVRSGRGTKMPSFHRDLYGERGQSEVDQLNGAVVREGVRLGIPTPANACLTETLQDMISGRLPRHKYAGKPEDFLSYCQRFKT